MKTAAPIPLLTFSRCNSLTRPAFTLFELLLVVLVLGICAAIFTPAVGDNLRSSRLRTAANVLAADIEFCSNECITRPSTPRALLFNITANTYSMIDLNSSAIISHPADSLPYTNDFATGRNEQLNGVTLTSIVSGTSNLTLLTFNPYGQPLLTADLNITITYNTSTLLITVNHTTGDVSITGS